MSDFTPDFERKLVYRKDEKRYVIESTCKYCGNTIIVDAYKWVPGAERQHADQCLGTHTFYEEDS